MKKTNIQKLIVLFLLIASLFSHSRVSFSRPGSFIRTPSSVINTSQNKFYIGVTNETVNTQDMVSSNAFYFRSSRRSGVEYGMSYTQRAPINLNDKNPPTEVAFHLNKEMYKKNNFFINAGVQDAFYQSDYKAQLSLFVSFIYDGWALKNGSKLQATIGMGSGKINTDSYNYLEQESHEPNVFFGFKIETPFMSRFSGQGVAFMVDYDGSGLNFGAQIPIANQITIATSFTHLEKIDNFNKYNESVTEKLYSDSPGFSIGFEYGFTMKNRFMPEFNQEPYKIQNINTKEECFFLIKEGVFNDPLTVNRECYDSELISLVNSFNQHIRTLHDSLIWKEQELKAEKISNISLKKQTKTLQDSVNMQYLNQQISQSEMNIAMKFLSNSLKHYYMEDYYLALEEINQAQNYLPQLAYTYAREGSIYYKLGNLQQATLNWNIALQLDPEYTEVRDMLMMIKQEKKSESSDIN